MFNKGCDILAYCEEKGAAIWEAAIADEKEMSGLSEEEIFAKARLALRVMLKSIEDPGDARTMGNLIGGEYRKMEAYKDKPDTLLGEVAGRAMMRAMGASQHNAAMGRICAAPTAGSCGIMPAALQTAAERLGSSEDDMVKAVLTSALIGKIIVQNATVAGAEGGCQAECGSAASMAAAALVEMAGGSPNQSLNAAAIALKNIMGLVCDPIAGLVEAPCSKRNASGVMNAMCSADMALAGIESIIPFDEVVDAMYEVGLSMDVRFKETALGGIAASPTGQKLSEKILK